MSGPGIPESWYWVGVDEAERRIDQASGRPRRFLILGAGMAGLAAAWELHRRGHGVEVLEGSERPGGRVFTHHFQNGSYGERGAMRIPLAHDYTHYYISQAARIPRSDLRRFYNSRGNGFLDVGGKTVRENDFRSLLPLFPGLSREERSIVSEGGPGALLGRAMGPLFQRLQPKFGKLLAGDFSDPELAALDEISWHTYLEQKASLTPAGVDLLGSMLTLGAVWQWSLAAILRDEIHQMHPNGTGWTGVFCEIAGGLDRLPSLLASRLPKGMIQYNTKVLDIERRASGGIVRVQSNPTGKVEEKPFERLLCTLPFPVLRRMQLDTFSSAKRAAIQGIHYASSTKVLLNYDTRWWQEAPLGLRGGRSVSDRTDGKVTVPRQTYYPNDVLAVPCGPDRVEASGVALRAEGGADLSGLFSLYAGATDAAPESPALLAAAERTAGEPGTILGAYTLNEGAQELCRLGPGAVEHVLRPLETIHGTGRVRSELREAESWCWDDQPWALGALAITPPGDLLQHFANAKKEEGPIYFAGEHVSIAPGWIQGSLESSLREVARMLENT